jgi:hypothetical protein
LVLAVATNGSNAFQLAQNISGQGFRSPQQFSEFPPLRPASSGSLIQPKPKIMKIQPHRRKSFAELWRRIFRRSARRHDPLLTLSMTRFNYTDGWSRTISKDEYGRSWA